LIRLGCDVVVNADRVRRFLKGECPHIVIDCLSDLSTKETPGTWKKKPRHFRVPLSPSC